MAKKYIKVCRIEELEEKKGLRYYEDDYTDIAVFKVNGKLFAVDNICPHNHTPKMHLGYIEDEHVLCPVHFFKFSLSTGKQTGEMGCVLKTYDIKTDGEFVYVEKPAGTKFNFEF